MVRGLCSDRRIDSLYLYAQSYTYVCVCIYIYIYADVGLRLGL